MSVSVNVAIVAASGGLGRHVLAQSLAAGYNVIAIVRNKDKLATLLTEEQKSALKGKVFEVALEATQEQGRNESIAQLAEILKTNEISTLLVASHLVGEVSIAAADASGTVKTTIVSGGAPCLHSATRHGLLAWRDLVEKTGNLKYKEMAGIHFRNFAALTLSNQDRFVLISPGYMLDLPERAAEDIELKNDIFLPFCNDQPLPYANCARFMTNAIVSGKVDEYLYHRVAISVKQGLPKP